MFSFGQKKLILTHIQSTNSMIVLVSTTCLIQILFSFQISCFITTCFHEKRIPNFDNFFQVRISVKPEVLPISIRKRPRLLYSMFRIYWKPKILQRRYSRVHNSIENFETIILNLPYEKLLNMVGRANLTQVWQP